MVQLTGLVLCLHGAAKITHRAQRIVNIVSQWHALATVYPGAVTHRSDKALLEDKEKVGKQQPPTFPGTLYAPAHPLLYHDSSEDIDHDTDSESDDSPRFSSDIEQSIHDLESIQKRQALGTAFPNLLDFIATFYHLRVCCESLHSQYEVRRWNEFIQSALHEVQGFIAMFAL
jgi:hypothetical protein